LLHDVYLDAIHNKEIKLSRIKDANYHNIIYAASSCWVKYEPNRKQCTPIGIDSSWNKKAFQGLDFYVVDAIAVDSKNEIQYGEWDYGLDTVRSESLESAAILMESKVAKCVLEDENEKADIISIDGSLVSRLVRNKPGDIPKISDIVNKHANVIFISKNSDTRTQFGSLGAKAADIYYFNQVEKSAGYSVPFENTQYTQHKVIEIYARLKEYTPLIKLEIPGTPISKINDSEIEAILDMLSFHSISGYPYCLKLAHENCKISNEDMDRLAGFYGLRNEVGSRDLLNE
jgi:NurA domain